MIILTVRTNGQITLPASVRKELGLKEGDVVSLEVQDGALLIKPKLVVDKSQAYFWSERWQAGEREAEEDIKVGRLKYFKNAQEAAQALISPDADDGVER
ncbi:MAG: AbrB/MazE/SpoVT family DNA-binding domain-containing protein [Firmicutes bacterium]|nr:AbrB/MazE/SpoVT family DNA-binding domain-containing protein [Bacillota bacterium]MCL5038773.1 AbrB/MazE/SpoVT family DNA-binding domain-containing protein [Bacillota bacterium]